MWSSNARRLNGVPVVGVPAIPLIATVSLSSAQIKNLFDAPVELAPAPGAGKFLELLSLLLVFTFGTQAYVNGAGGAPVIYPTWGGSVDFLAVQLGAGFASIGDAFKQTASCFFNYVNTYQLLDVDAATNYLNKALTLQETSAQNKELVTGDGTAVIKTIYRIHEF